MRPTLKPPFTPFALTLTRPLPSPLTLTLPSPLALTLTLTLTLTHAPPLTLTQRRRVRRPAASGGAVCLPSSATLRQAVEGRPHPVQPLPLPLPPPPPSPPPPPTPKPTSNQADDILYPRHEGIRGQVDPHTGLSADLKYLLAR